MAKKDTAPVDTAPVDTAPVDTAPVDTAPVDTAPVDTAPVDTAPVDTAPVDTEAFVLRDCGFGKAGEVVTLSASDAEQGRQHGMLDLHPEAIKAARAAK